MDKNEALNLIKMQISDLDTLLKSEARNEFQKGSKDMRRLIKYKLASIRDAISSILEQSEM